MTLPGRGRRPEGVVVRDEAMDTSMLFAEMRDAYMYSLTGEGGFVRSWQVDPAHRPDVNLAELLRG